MAWSRTLESKLAYQQKHRITAFLSCIALTLLLAGVFSHFVLDRQGGFITYAGDRHLVNQVTLANSCLLVLYCAGKEIVGNSVPKTRERKKKKRGTQPHSGSDWLLISASNQGWTCAGAKYTSMDVLYQNNLER